MSIEHYSRLTGDVESKLDEADMEAVKTDKRLSHEEVFGSVRKRLGEDV